MKPYIAQIRSNLRLMVRDRAVLFFSFLFPLSFFFLFAQAFHASANAGAMSQIIAMVLIIGVLIVLAVGTAFDRRIAIMFVIAAAVIFALLRFIAKLIDHRYSIMLSERNAIAVRHDGLSR